MASKGVETVIYQYKYANKTKGELITTYENMDIAANQFITEKRCLNAVKTNIRQSIRSYNSQAYGYAWGTDEIIKKTEKSEERKDRLIETELKALRVSIHKGLTEHDIYFFYDSQEEKLKREINTRFKKYNFEIDSYPYMLEPLIFKMELRR